MSAASSIFLGDWNQLKWGNRENFAMFLGIEPTKMGKTMENNGVFFCEKKATHWFYNVLYDHFLARNLWDLTEHMISSTSDLRWRRIRFNEWVPPALFLAQSLDLICENMIYMLHFRWPRTHIFSITSYFCWRLSGRQTPCSFKMDGLTLAITHFVGS